MLRPGKPGQGCRADRNEQDDKCGLKPGMQDNTGDPGELHTNGQVPRAEGDQRRKTGFRGNDEDLLKDCAGSLGQHKVT